MILWLYQNGWYNITISQRYIIAAVDDILSGKSIYIITEVDGILSGKCMISWQSVDDTLSQSVDNNVIGSVNNILPQSVDDNMIVSQRYTIASVDDILSGKSIYYHSQ